MQMSPKIRGISSLLKTAFFRLRPKRDLLVGPVISRKALITVSTKGPEASGE
jgi:hypothetical protein